MKGDEAPAPVYIRTTNIVAVSGYRSGGSLIFVSSDNDLKNGAIAVKETPEQIIEQILSTENPLGAQS
jgi:hypothetical protein